MAAVKIEGLRRFTRELNKVDRELGREMRQVHLRVAGLVADRSRAAASSRASRGIKPKATQRAARLQVVSKPEYALAFYLGTRRRSGWYARKRYDRSKGRQFRPWVGNQWEPGETGGKPYFIGDAINRSLDEVIEIYDEGITELARKAFPG